MADDIKTYSQADIDALTQKMHNAIAEAEDAKRRVKTLEAIDPEDFKKLKYELDGYKKKAAEGDPKKIEELVKEKEAEIRAGVQRQLEELTQERNGLTNRLKEREVVDTVFNTAAPRFVDHAYDDVKDYIRRFCETDKNGNIVFKDDKGQPRYKKNSPATLAGPDDFVEWLTEAKPHWAKAPGGSGSKDAGQRNTNGTAGKVLDLGQLEGMTKEQLDKIPLDDLMSIKI